MEVIYASISLLIYMEPKVFLLSMIVVIDICEAKIILVINAYVTCTRFYRNSTLKVLVLYYILCNQGIKNRITYYSRLGDFRCQQHHATCIFHTFPGSSTNHFMASASAYDGIPSTLPTLSLPKHTVDSKWEK